ncbi:MAG: iron-containing alcohol dehydrogenase, partial [Methanobacteriota archaeon]
MPRIRRQEGETLIVLGPGAVRNLRQLLRELGSTRPYLVTGAHLAGGPVGARVREALGDGLVGTHSRSQPHVPEATA